MLLHLVAAEQLRSQRRLVQGAFCLKVFTLQSRQYNGQVSENGLGAQLQLMLSFFAAGAGICRTDPDRNRPNENSILRSRDVSANRIGGPFQQAVLLIYGIASLKSDRYRIEHQREGNTR
jgi:hypothetical protein